MRIIAAFTLTIIAAFIEGVVPLPFLGVFAATPLVLISLNWATLWTKPSVWLWLGLMAGAILDLFKLNPIGSLSIFYVSFMYLLHLMKVESDSISKMWWRQIVISAVVAFVLPWYLLLINGQFGLASREVAIVSIQSALYTSILVAIPRIILKLKSLR